MNFRGRSIRRGTAVAGTAVVLGLGALAGLQQSNVVGVCAPTPSPLAVDSANACPTPTVPLPPSPPPPPPPPPSTGTAVLWADPAATTGCARSSTPVVYNAATDCTLAQANSAALAGDNVNVRCGTYPAQTLASITARSSFAAQVSFTAETGALGCWKMANGVTTILTSFTRFNYMDSDFTGCDSLSFTWGGAPGIPYTAPQCPNIAIGSGSSIPASTSNVTLDHVHAAFASSTGQNVIVTNSDFGPSWDNHGIIHGKTNVATTGLRPDVQWINNKVHDHYNTPEFATGCPDRPDSTPGVNDGCGFNNPGGTVPVALHEGCGPTLNDTNNSMIDRSMFYNCQDTAILVKPGSFPNTNVTIQNSYFGTLNGGTCPAACKIDLTNINQDQFGMKFIHNTVNGGSFLFGNSAGTLCTGCLFIGNIIPTTLTVLGAPWTVSWNQTAASSAACGSGATCTNNTANFSYAANMAADKFHLLSTAPVRFTVPVGASTPTNDIDGDVRSNPTSPGVDHG